ncbi:hypothetical protein HDU91_004424, partial [Kappamyces sp. JEL0680]
PGKDLVPSYSNGIEYMETLFFVSGIAGQLVVCNYVFSRWMYRRTHQLLYLLITQCSLLVFITLRMAYLYAVFESNFALMMLGYFQLAMYALSTGLCSLYTVHFVNLVMQADENVAQRNYMAALLIHLVTAGSCYVIFLEWFEYYIGTFVYYWSCLFQVWIFIYFCSNTLPLTIVLWKRTSGGTANMWDRMIKIHYTDPWYFAILGLSLLLIAVYLLVSCIQAFTSLLGTASSC